MILLTDLPTGCFDGVIPAILATCSAAGSPNATWLSHVFRVDDRHIALSCQFFRKTRDNLAEHPHGQVLIVDPPSFRQWTLEIRFDRSETDGKTFSEMQSRLQVIASMTDQSDVFVLRSADIFEVLEVHEVGVDVGAPHPAPEVRKRDPMTALAQMTNAIASSTDLETVVDAGLGVLTGPLGYESVSLYLLEESEGVLYALASRGSPRSGVGARVGVGVGIIGTCAERRIAIRVANTMREVYYGNAVKEQIAGKRGDRDREIPLPGLDAALSVLAVPLILQGNVFGVLAAESQRALAFDDGDTLVMTTAGHLLAQGIALERDDTDLRAPTAAEPPASTDARTLRVRYYEADDSVFLDGEYLIKGLPGKILWLVLTLRESEKRSIFLNRELRLHPFLKLPAYKDNLETRLLLLQRRLAEKKMPVLRLHREQRGRLRIECDLRIELERIAE